MTTIVSTATELFADSIHFLETTGGWESVITGMKINFTTCHRAAYAITGTNHFSPAAAATLQREIQLVVGKLNVANTLTNSDISEELVDFIKSSGEFEIILVTANRGRWVINSSGVTYIPEKSTIALGSGAGRIHMALHKLGERSMEELLAYTARHDELTRGPWTRLQLSNLKEFTDAPIE